MLLYDRYRQKASPDDRVNAEQLLLLSYIGVLLHVFMDFTNSYGVRLLMPFSDRWFYGDALYIVDPWLYLAARRRLVARRRHAVRAPARIGVTLAAIYVVGDARVERRRAARSGERPGARRPSGRDALHGDAGGRQSLSA